MTSHLRARDDGATQPTTTVELFFDLVYVFDTLSRDRWEEHRGSRCSRRLLAG
jgi:hypothetical protein